MTAQLTSLIIAQDTAELVRDQIALILLEESAAQQVLADSTFTVVITRADDSDTTATAAEDTPDVLEFGDYVITAGTLTAGVGTWTCVAPSGASEVETTTAADDDLLFPTLGLTITVTAGSEVWDTGDIITVTSYDPLQWKLRVFIERSNPYAEFQRLPDQDADSAVPIIAVAFDQDSFNESASNVVERQKSEARYNIDCYGYGKSTATTAGHTPGDSKASLEAMRAVRLVRKILMAGHYTFLGLARGIVWKRFIEGRQRFPPEIEAQWGQNVVGFRIVLRVDFNETSPQVTGEILTIITLTMKRTETGETFLTTQFAV